MRKAANVLFALLALAALTASVVVYAQDLDSRKPAAAFAKRYAIALRRPEVAQSLSLASSAGEANDLMADTALRDAVEPVHLANATDAVRQSWLDLVPKTNAELNDASLLALDAMRAEPGWPYHQALLGQAVYAAGSRTFSPELVTKYERWRAPLLAGATAANVDDNLWQALAMAYIQTWPDLGRFHEKTSTTVFRRAFEDPDFVTDRFALAVQTIGKERTVRSIPDRAKPLWAAFQQLAKSNDVLTAWPVHQRWDAAEWHERGEDLAAIEKQWKRGDVDETRRLCAQWAWKHSVWDYDSPAAHKQVARLLELWPGGTEGQWRSDPRAEIVRYFLAGRTKDVDGAILGHALDSLANVPEPVAARIRVLAGDLAAADSIARAADDFGSFSWTPYILELARYWAEKDKAKARAAFAQLAPAARQECDSIAVETLIEGKKNVVEAFKGLPPRTAVGTPIPICMDRTGSLVATFSAVEPAIVDYGWDSARSATILINAPNRNIAIGARSGSAMRSLTSSLKSQSLLSPAQLQIRPSPASAP